MCEIEIWKPVVGYEGLYEVSNLGRVRSLGFDKSHPGRILKYDNRRGYLHVSLYKGKEIKVKRVHRLVAEAFLPNPDGLETVNHINENKTDNTVWINPDGTVNLEKSNLEWKSNPENSRHGSRNERVRQATITPVIRIEDGKAQYFESAETASKMTGEPRQEISACLHQSKVQWKYGVKTFQFCHKEVPYGFSDTPLEVGAECREKHCAELRDNCGWNISFKNPIYAEVTGVYYLWRNVKKFDMICVEQYRRVLDVKPEDKRPIIESGKIIACKPLVFARGTVKNHFINCHSEKYWELFKEAVHKTAPQYDEAFVKWLETSSPENPAKIYYSCGMGMYKTDYDKYCEFLFPVLDYIYKALGGSVEAVTETVRQDILEGRCRQVSSHGTGLDECVRYQRQVCGFVQERAFTMWARENFEGRIHEAKYILKENTVI